MQVHIAAHMIVMHSAHNERKRETIVNILLENLGTSKKNNTQAAQSARSAQSAVCSLHGLRFNCNTSTAIAAWSDYALEHNNENMIISLY